MFSLKRSFVAAAAALLVLAGFSPAAKSIEVQAAGDATKITILHTNDTHARIVEGDHDGMGFAKLATLAKEIEASNPNTLLLDAGDTFHGTPFATLEQGESIVKIFNMLGYDAMAAGNHDFNYGYKRLLELRELTDFPVLGANVRYKETNERVLEPYVIKEVDGVKLGIFGLATPETHYKTSPKNVEGLVFADPVKEAQEMVAALKAEKVDAVIAVTHLGIDESSTDTSIKVAKGAPGIDLIVDGHSHTVMVKGEKHGEDTLIVSTGEYTKNLGVVELTFDGNKKLEEKTARLISKKDAENTVPDKEVTALIEGIENDQKAIKNEHVGSTNVKLDGERENVRTRETNLGNLATDAMIAETGADLAFTNGGGLRASINEGDITLGNIISVSPFGNYVVTMKMKGSVVKAALEHGVSDYPNTKGAFPQIGGMSFVLDASAPKGERVKDLRVKGEPINLDQEYLVATNDFLAIGGDDYTMLKDQQLVNEYQALEEILKRYIKENSPLTNEVEGRIKVSEGGAGSEGGGEAVLPFKDVAKDSDAYEAIKSLYESKIVKGKAADLFAPNDAFTRSQVASMLVRGMKLESKGKSPFTDIAWLPEDVKKEVAAAYEAGIVKGVSAKTFAPNSKLTRAQLALMLQRAYDQSGKSAAGAAEDILLEEIANLPQETEKAIRFALTHGFMELKDGKFNPNTAVTRAEGAKALHALFTAK